MAVAEPRRSDSGPEVDTVGIYVKNHDSKCREFFIWTRLDHRKLGEKGSLLLLLEDPLISETCRLEESASHHVDNWHLDTWTPGHLDTWTLLHVDTWTLEHLETSTRARTPEIHQKSSEINVLENGEEHLGRLVKA